ncbi:putative multiple sugar transport system permease protein [Eubacterium uniforme]|uniref:Xylose transport system permease protein XylH n=1 Tax=Eubacterium uniforme TaxID=39495 RepID=A0A1T4W4J0_9FIRM|nr:putative multiple sugar transport system permease protein [Eubacterium uniforme]
MNTSSIDVKKLIKKYTMIIALVVVFIFFTFLTEGKLVKAQNISNLLLQNAYVLVMACGMLLCILTGGNVDLSVGSTLCLSAALAANSLEKGMNPFLAILIPMVVAVIIGIWQGWLIGYIHIPPFICTLAGMFLFRGFARVVLNSKTIAVMNEKFVNIFASYIKIGAIDKKHEYVSALIVGVIVAVIIVLSKVIGIANKKKKGYDTSNSTSEIVKAAVIAAVVLAYSFKLYEYKGIPVMLVWILIVVLVFHFVTSSTVFGRYFYAVGGNEKATKLSGIDPRKVYFWAYFWMSVLAGFSGLLVASRIGSVDGNMGNSYEMDAIASCFIGGASAYGGSGNIPGVMVGAILLGVINQGMSIYGLSDQWQYVVKGGVLLVAVVFDVVSNHKTGKS